MMAAGKAKRSAASEIAPHATYWASKISTCWARTVAGPYEVGRLLLKAQDALSRAEFAELVGRPGEGGKLPFSYDVARRLMAIGEDARMGKILAHGQKNRLPPSWRSQYELTKFTDKQLQEAFEQGSIDSETQRYEIENLRERFRRRDAPEAEAEPSSPEQEAPPSQCVPVQVTHRTLRHSVVFSASPASSSDKVCHYARLLQTGATRTMPTSRPRPSKPTGLPSSQPPRKCCDMSRATRRSRWRMPLSMIWSDDDGRGPRHERGRAMKLYHFTDFYFLKNGGTILKEGLKPAVDKQGWVLPPHNVVWLTTDESYTFERQPECRITLVVSSHDRRLVRWDKWLHKHGEHEIIAVLDRDHPGWRSTYVYFGNVPLSMSREVGYADPERRAAYERDQQAQEPPCA
jgi:hypothetical protein